MKLNLIVSEASLRDVGRGIARIDPDDMKNISAEIGDIIEIHGKKITVAKLMPTFIEDRKKGMIKIDGITRNNAQIGLDEVVGVEKAKVVKIAERVVLTPVTSIRGEIPSRYIGKLLEGLPLVKGDRIRTTFIGTQPREFIVSETKPADIPVLIDLNTVINLKDTKTTERVGVKITYEDIGGLGKEIKKIREMIELPLKHPELFEKLGIEAPKGVLLHGPPGCGKTLIAKAVANETNTYFIHINGPEIMHKFYGESEARLREVFASADKNTPSIIFIDEIDAIAPKREGISEEKQVEKRVVGQLLALMDGLESRGKVIVIGATNIPNVLDPALRRPGRFDRELCISIPDRNSRLEILNIYTRGMPLAKNVSLDKIADITHGFVGADLSALCREAAMACIRKILPKIEIEEYIPTEMLLSLEVCMDDFMDALREVNPSVLREVFVEIPDVRWDDIGGLEEVKNRLKEFIEWPMKYPELFEYTRTKSPKGILLYGHPGTGKTLIAKAIANESGSNFISIKGPELISKFLGESERGIREIFKKAKQSSPCILFFDEIDAIALKRGLSGDSGLTERILSQLLTEMDGLEELRGVTVLAATNRIDIIDPALLRPGRFDILIELQYPNSNEILEIFNVHTKGKPLEDDVNFNLLIKIMNDTLSKNGKKFNGADIESICRIASYDAMREFVISGNLKKIDFKIKQKHFESALKP